MGETRMLLGVAISLAMLAGAEPIDATGAALQSSMIWTAAVPTGEQAYVAFRKTFVLDTAPLSAPVAIFADSRYSLWVNGTYVLRGPCRFDPIRPEYDALDLAPYLHAGRNMVAAWVHHYHDGRAQDDPEALNGRTMRHAPGFTLRLDAGNGHVIGTDDSWRVCKLEGFKPSPPAWGCILDDITASKIPAGWTETDFDDGAWDKPVSVDGGLWGPLHARSLPLLRETPLTPATLLRLSREGSVRPRSFAPVLPIDLAPGESVTVDMGQTVLAYDLIDLDAAEGAVLEVAHGLAWLNNALEETYGANRYCARDGRQTYVSSDSAGYRYMTLAASVHPIRIMGVTAMDRRYPFERVGSFTSSDPALDELWARGVWTVTLCSEDGYLDCNARERAEWMGDAAVCEYPATRVALAGRGADGGMIWSDPRLARNMLRHIAQSQQPDGRLKAHHPSNRWDIHGYIEDYACLWVMMLRQYYENTGDRALVDELWPALERQLQWFADHRTDRGLVRAREFVFVDNPVSYKVCEGTTLNAYLAGALSDAALLAEVAGKADARDRYAADAAALRNAINRALWDEGAGSYIGGFMEDGSKAEPNAFAAMVALHFNVPTPERVGSVRDFFVKHVDKTGSPYSHYFVLDALYKGGAAALDELALDIMRKRWAPTLTRTDHETVCEGFGGPAYCHNIGAMPVYFLSAYTLGVRREGPVAEKRIVIEPHLGELTRAEGVVSTELGPVRVSWRREADAKKLAFRFEVPEGAGAALRIPYLQASSALTLDGQAYSLPEASSVQCVSGVHEGTVVFE